MNDRLLLIFSGLLLCLAGLPAPAGAAGTAPPDDLGESHSFDRSDYVFGEFGNITLIIRNLCGEEVRIGSVLVRTDWQQSNESYPGQILQDRVLEASGGSLACRIAFRVPGFVNAVDHAWNISVKYAKGPPASPNLTWRSENLTDLRVSDFEVVAAPDSMTVTAGQVADITVTVWGRNDFKKTVALQYRAFRDVDDDHQIWGLCYPGWINGPGVSHAFIRTNTSTPAGKYRVSVQGSCDEGYTFWGQQEMKGTYRHTHVVLEVKPPPRAFVDISANCAAQLGIGAVVILAAVTGALIAVEGRRKGGPPTG